MIYSDHMKADKGQKNYGTQSVQVLKSETFSFLRTLSASLKDSSIDNSIFFETIGWLMYIPWS